MKAFRCLIAVALSMLCALQAAANESKEHAVRAVAAWSAFECSSLASVSKDTSEQERLFMFGLDQGRRFIAAHSAGKIKKEDLSRSAPWGFLILLQGPSADFMLGRIFESAQDNALEDIFQTGETFNSDEVQVTLARTKFRKMNCQLIGK